MRAITSFILFFLLSSLAHSQRNAPVLWSTPIGHGNQWIHLAAEGTLIAAMKETVITATDTLDYTELWGFDQATGKIKWKYKRSFPRMISGFDPVPNLPYLKLRDVPLTIIDPSDGHAIIDVEAESINNIKGYGFLYESGHLWIDGSIGGSEYLSIFELATGKKVWSRREFLAPPDRSKMNAFSTVVAAANNNYKPRLLCSPINNGKDHIILATGDALFYNNVYKVQTSTGDIVWKTESPNPNKGKLIRAEADTSFLRLIPGPRHFFYVRANWITACNYSDGKESWGNVVKTTSKVGEIIYDTRGMILCTVSTDVKAMMSTGRFHMVNEETGKEVWTDALKFNGGLSKYQYTEKGLAVITENPESGASNLNFIDVDNGKYVLSKQLHLAGTIRSLQVTPKGVFYATNREVSIVSPDGSQLIDLPKHNFIQGSLPVTDDAEKAYVFYKEDQNLYEVDKKNATARILNKDKIDFKGNDFPDRLEARKNGLILYSANNMTFVNTDGTTRYSVHYKAVWNLLEKAKLLEKLLAVILDVGKGLMAMSMQQQAALSAPGVTAEQKDQIRSDADQQMRAYAEVGTAEVAGSLKSFNEVKLRYEGSKSAGDMLVILTTLDKKNILAVVNKDTGEMISKIDLVGGEDNPRYEIDEATGRLFYIGQGMDGLWAYGMNK